MPVEIQVIQQAHRFALDPTPRQERMLRSHAGARRYVYNWTHAAIMTAADERQAQKDSGEEPTAQIPGQFDLGPVFTAFKNTARGCRACRALLARSEGGAWASARDGSADCPQAGGAHDPTRVSCSRCWDVLDDKGGEWADRDGRAACPEAKAPGGPHEPRSEFMAWTGDVFTGSMQAAMRDADTAWKRFLGGKARRPRFKKKGKSAESFQVHGDGLRMPETIKALVNETPRPGARTSPKAKARKGRERHSGTAVRQQASHRILLPKIGAVAIMSDDSLHPAMARSRSRATPDASRHMGNRRRARSLQRQLRKTPAKAAALAELLRQVRNDAGLTAAQAAALLNRAADARAQADAKAKAAGLEAAARELLDAAGDDAELRKKALVKLRYAQKKADGIPSVKAGRTDRWDAAKLERLEATGTATGGLGQAGVICDAYGLRGEQAARLTSLAAQARIIRATISLGADGLWWCSAGAEIPYEVRVAPDPVTGRAHPAPGPKQRAGGLVGIDFGVREVMTVSDGTVVPNPRHYEEALGELRDAQRRLSRSQPGSRRREKDRRLVGLIHADVARLRADEIHRATTMLVRSHDVIAIEGWNVQQMMRDGSKDVPRRVRRDRNRALADAAIGMGREQLKYKGPRNGAVIMVTDPDARTGRTCCLHKTARTTPLAPGEEMFTSDKCDCARGRRENTSRALAGWAAQELKRGPSPGGPAEPRGEDVRPVVAVTGGGGRSPVKRAASTSPRAG
jgi:putative transposase